MGRPPNILRRISMHFSSGISVGNSTNRNPFRSMASNLTLHGGAPGAALVLALHGQNSFAGGTSSAGIGVPESASLTIQCAPRCLATNALLNATGGSNAAGIGGNENAANGAITIKGGIVTATGGSQGAGIGTGKKSSMGIFTGGDITVSGGRVVALRQDGLVCGRKRRAAHLVRRGTGATRR